MNLRTCGFLGSYLIAAALIAPAAGANDQDRPDGEIVQYGEMHEAIGLQKHEGRVAFQKLVGREHFFGVAAVEGLEGEATILDGNVILTTVDDDGRLRASDSTAIDKKATLLVGTYVPSWTKQAVDRSVKADRFDQYIADAATKAGLNVDKPFLFIVEGEFSDVRLHVINGACPIRARMKKEVIADQLKPFESEMSSVRGTIVSVFARDAVGKLTHPATSTHCHLVFTDPVSGKTVTGHLEQVGVRQGAQVSVPQL